MNDNHMHASRQGCASVSKWTHQLCAEAEGRQGPLCGDNLQPSKRLLIPFGGKTSEGSLVRCQLTFFLWPLTSAAARESGRWLIYQRRKRELVKQRACAFSLLFTWYGYSWQLLLVGWVFNSVAVLQHSKPGTHGAWVPTPTLSTQKKAAVAKESRRDRMVGGT